MKREEFVRACRSNGYLFAGGQTDKPALEDPRNPPADIGRLGLLTAVDVASAKESAARSQNPSRSIPKRMNPAFHSRHSSGQLRDTLAKHHSRTNTRPTTANIFSTAEGGETSRRRPSQCKLVYRAPQSRIGSGLAKKRTKSSLLQLNASKKLADCSGHQSAAEVGLVQAAKASSLNQTVQSDLRIRVSSFKAKDLKLTVPSPTGSPLKPDSHQHLHPKPQPRVLQRRPATAAYAGHQSRPRLFGSKPPSPTGKADVQAPTSEEGQQDQAIINYIDKQMYTKNKVIKKLNEYLKDQPLISDTLVDYKEKLIEFHYQQIKSQLSSKLSQIDFDEIFHRDHHKNLDEKKEMVAAFLLGFSHNTRYKKFCKLFKHYLDKSDARNSSKVGIIKGLVSVSDFWDENFYREILRQGDYHSIKTQFRKKFKDSHIL